MRPFVKILGPLAIFLSVVCRKQSNRCPSGIQNFLPMVQARFAKVFTTRNTVVQGSLDPLQSVITSDDFSQL